MRGVEVVLREGLLSESLLSEGQAAESTVEAVVSWDERLLNQFERRLSQGKAAELTRGC